MNSSCNGVGHFPARVGTSVTGFGTAAHIRIYRKTLAVLRAGLANLSANATRVAMMVRYANHEIGTGLADLRAIVQQADVFRLRMLSTFFQAVANG